MLHSAGVRGPVPCGADGGQQAGSATAHNGHVHAAARVVPLQHGLVNALHAARAGSRRKLV
jgi:hypothetical protein